MNFITWKINLSSLEHHLWFIFSSLFSHSIFLYLYDSNSEKHLFMLKHIKSSLTEPSFTSLPLHIVRMRIIYALQLLLSFLTLLHQCAAGKVCCKKPHIWNFVFLQGKGTQQYYDLWSQPSISFQVLTYVQLILALSGVILVSKVPYIFHQSPTWDNF